MYTHTHTQRQSLSHTYCTYRHDLSHTYTHRHTHTHMLKLGCADPAVPRHVTLKWTLFNEGKLNNSPFKWISTFLLLLFSVIIYQLGASCFWCCGQRRSRDAVLRMLWARGLVLAPYQEKLITFSPWNPCLSDLLFEDDMMIWPLLCSPGSPDEGTLWPLPPLITQQHYRSPFQDYSQPSIKMPVLFARLKLQAPD